MYQYVYICIYEHIHTQPVFGQKETSQAPRAIPDPYINMFFSINAYMHICIYVYTYICIHVSICIYKHIHRQPVFGHKQTPRAPRAIPAPYVQIYSYKCIYVYMYIYICKYVSVCIYTYIQMYTYAASILTHTNASGSTRNTCAICIYMCV